MPAFRKKCEFCRKQFWACRSDELFCTERCRDRNRAENLRFGLHPKKKSNLRGITWNRWRGRWEARGGKERKYLGSFNTIQEAYKFQQEFENDTVR